MKKIVVIMLLFCGIGLGKTIAQKQALVLSDKKGWHKIAETNVDFDKETDEVNVLIADKFAKLSYHVTDAPIQLIDMDVYFEDGTMKTAMVGFSYKPEGTWSREIDLPGNEKEIKKIVFRYKTLNNTRNAKAHLEIWGKKTNEDNTK